MIPPMASRPAKRLVKVPDDDAAAIATGIADIEAGRFVPHEKVRVWLLNLALGKKVPPPRPSSGRAKRSMTSRKSART